MAYYAEAPKGEIVLVISGADKKDPQKTTVTIADLRKNLSAKDSAYVWALISGKSKKEAYADVLAYDKL